MSKVTTVKEVFERMPARFATLPAGDLSAVVQFELSGEGGGQYYVTVNGAACSVAEGVSPNPSMTLGASAQDFLGLVNGDLKPMPAFMQGLIRVRGDVSLAMRLQALFAA